MGPGTTQEQGFGRHGLCSAQLRVPVSETILWRVAPRMACAVLSSRTIAGGRKAAAVAATFTADTVARYRIVL